MPDEKSEKRVERLNKIMAKMQITQQEDGTWMNLNQSWAPVLSQVLAAKAGNRARQVGAKVDDAMLQKMARHAQEAFEKNHPEMLAAAAKGAKTTPLPEGWGKLHRPRVGRPLRPRALGRSRGSPWGGGARSLWRG